MACIYPKEHSWVDEKWWTVTDESSTEEILPCARDLQKKGKMEGYFEGYPEELVHTQAL